ncbi:MAG: hypothetical protein V7K27_12850 [Nostoc sp.]
MGSGEEAFSGCTDFFQKSNTSPISSVIASNLIIIRQITPRTRQWLQWRADILTDFLAHLYREVKPVNPNLLVAIAPNIYDWAFQEYLQESPT